MTGCRSARATSTAGVCAGISRPTRRSPTAALPPKRRRCSSRTSRYRDRSRAVTGASGRASTGCARVSPARSTATSTAGGGRADDKLSGRRAYGEQLVAAHEGEQKGRQQLQLRAVRLECPLFAILFGGAEDKRTHAAAGRGRRRKERHPGHKLPRRRPALNSVHDPEGALCAARAETQGEQSRGSVIRMSVRRARCQDQRRPQLRYRGGKVALEVCAAVRM